jgi:acyl-CoA synthetase (AMP-forming)/AMP-acid ligase II/NADP-dependent 3-hydroxy acid dehydrogenase YdfG
MRAASAQQAYRDIVDRATAAARTVPGVTDAAVRVRRSREPLPSADSALPAATGGDPADADGRIRSADLGSADLRPAQLDGAPLVLPDDAPATLTEALLRAARAGETRGTTYVLGDGSEEHQSYRQLLEDAARLLPGLRDSGLRPGDSVLIHCDDNRNFVTGFWACLLGGFVPTPIGMAPGYSRENAVTRRLHDAWELLDQPPVLTDAAFASQVAMLRTLWGGVGPAVLAAEELRAAQPTADLYECGPEDPAVHLLTSGSTGVPKCVRHYHRTVIARAYANAQANGFGSRDVTLNFMPLDHVAGMTMHNLRDVIIQCDHVNARTDAFISDPLRWLTWIERYRVTNTSGPNFVITLVTALAERIAQGNWDLSSLKDITNGGEAIVSRTTHEFLRMLALHGMAPDVMRPAWGMSEVCGGVVHSTLRGDQDDVNVVTVDNRTMGGTLRLLPGPAPGHPTFTAVGFPVNGTSVRVVDPEDRVLPELRIGRLQVRGASLMAGYYKNPQANTKAMTADGWFDTGDLAFVWNGRLVMTGREKDVIVVRSANYACHEIESVVDEVDGVLSTYVAAAGEHDDATGTDELLVFCVLTDDDPARRRAVVREIGGRLARQVGLRPRRVVPVPRDAFPKTSAGKAERARLLAQYQAGLFEEALAEIGMGRGEPQDAAPWLFQEVWVPAEAAAGTAPAGTWLVLGDADLADRIHAFRGAGPVVSAVPGPGYARLSDLAYRVDPASPADYAVLRTDVTREHGEIGVAIHALATRSYASPADAITRGLELSAPSVHSMLKAFADSDTPLLVVTTGSCAAEAPDDIEPVHGTISALVRTANAERGRPWIRQLDLRRDESDPAGAVVAELAAADADELVAMRAGGRLVSRIRPVPDASAAGAVGRIRPGGLYLITGGLGGIGHRLARLLLAEFGAIAVLVGRSAPDGERAARLAALAQLGPVTYRQADVADAAALSDIVQEAERQCGRPLDGVLHLAGAGISRQWDQPDARLLVREQAAEFRRMYHAKVHGTYALAAVLEDRPDALLVLFSSVNARFGATAFGAYASASAFLPAFAAYWYRRGRRVQCQQWSLWAEPGAGGPAPAAARRGFRPIPPDEGVRLFLDAVAQPDVSVLIGLDDANEHVACEVDAAFLDRLEVTVVPGDGSTADAGLVREAVAAALRPARASVRVARSAAVTGRTARLGGGTAPARDLEAAVADAWGEVLGCAAVLPEEHFFDLGGNSMVAIRLVDRLNTDFGTRMTVQQLYEHPTARDLAGEIRRLSGEATLIAPPERA